MIKRQEYFYTCEGFNLFSLSLADCNLACSDFGGFDPQLRK